MNYATIIVSLILILVIAWNVFPKFRSQMKGTSTIIEGVLGAGLTYFGLFAQALDEAQGKGLIPEDYITYVPIVLCVWIIVKRIQTSTPVLKD